MDLNQMGIDPRKALAVGAIAQDLLKPKRVDDLEAFLARYPHITQHIEVSNPHRYGQKSLYPETK
mgnify:CR=1 FL=1